MILKSIQILFLLIANTLLLASNIIIHHHHNDQVCFVNSHTHNQTTGCDGTDHESDNTDYESHCVLKQTFVVLPQSTRISTDQHLDFKFLINIQDFQSDSIFAYDFCPLRDVNIRYLSRPDGASLYALVLINSHGLRAPPLS